MIISKMKTKYWERTHKYGLQIPKDTKKAKKLDGSNGITLWMDAIRLEMKNVRVAFEEYHGNPVELIGYQKIEYHMIFNVKISENFRRKARYIAGVV